MKKCAVIQGQLSLWDLLKEKCKVVQEDLSSIIEKYKQKPVYKDDELKTLPREEPWKVGDLVEFEHNGNQQGKIFSTYNNGHTVNVIWNNKHTAVCINNLIKIQS